jgi:two-component system response regulator NreC
MLCHHSANTPGRSIARQGELVMTTTPARKHAINVLCVDDHAVVAEGLQSFLSSAMDINCVGRLTSASDLVNQVKATGTNVVLMDIEMGGVDPFEALQDLVRQCPETRVIFLTAHLRDHYIDAAFSAGAWGYVTKDEDPQNILNAIRRVSNGEYVMNDQVRQRCDIESNGRTSSVHVKPVSKLQSLSAREQQVLRMIGKGMSRMQIAESLCRSPKTVDAHRAAIMEKTGIHDRVELARFAIREGLVEA